MDPVFFDYYDFCEAYVIVPENVYRFYELAYKARGTSLFEHYIEQLNEYTEDFPTLTEVIRYLRENQ